MRPGLVWSWVASGVRAVGNSVVPLVFLAVSAVLNIALDLWFVIGLNFGVAGAAGATVIAQYVSGIGIMICALIKCPQKSLILLFTDLLGMVRCMVCFSVF